LFQPPPPPLEPIRVARRSALVGYRDAGVGGEAGAGAAGGERGNGVVVGGRGRGDGRVQRGHVWRGGAAQRGSGRYEMRGVGGRFGVWAGRGGRGRGGRGGQHGREEFLARGFRGGGRGQAGQRGGGTRAPPAEQRHGLSRAEWLRRFDNRRPLRPAVAERVSGPAVVIHYHHHHY